MARFVSASYQAQQPGSAFRYPGEAGVRSASRPDLLYFADNRHSLDLGEPLVLVECKRLIKDEKELKAAAGQVRGYALWVLPAYYVITDARMVRVWDFQGAIAPT